MVVLRCDTDRAVAIALLREVSNRAPFWVGGGGRVFAEGSLAGTRCRIPEECDRVNLWKEPSKG